MKTTFDEKTNTYVIEEDAPKPPVASLEQAGVLGGIASMDVMGLPVGKAAVGALGGIVIDRFLGDRIAQWGSLGNLAVAWVISRFGRNFLGSTATDAVVFVLTYEAIMGPVDNLLSQIWAKAGQTASARQSGSVSASQVGVATSTLGPYAGTM